MHDAVRDLRDLVSYRLAMLANLNDRSGHAHIKETFGLTLGEWRVLGNISACGPVTFADLSRAMAIDKGQLSRTVTELIECGYVDGDQPRADRRMLTLTLTRAGRRQHDRILAFAIERNEAVLSVLTDVDRRALDRVLLKLAAFVEAEHAALSRGTAHDAELAAKART